MGYTAPQDMAKLPRRELELRYRETQVVARVAIAEALTLGGIKAERNIEAKVASTLATEPLCRPAIGTAPQPTWQRPCRT